MNFSQIFIFIFNETRWVDTWHDIKYILQQEQSIMNDKIKHQLEKLSISKHLYINCCFKSRFHCNLVHITF